MLTNEKYAKLYIKTSGASLTSGHRVVDEEFAEFAVNRLVRKVKEKVEEMIESEHIQNRTYALEVLLDKETLADYMSETLLDEHYGYDYDLPIMVAKETNVPGIVKSAELFTKEYIDTFDADGELLKKAIGSVIDYVNEALKKKTATDGVE